MRKVSVLLAAFHGEKYIHEQIASILPQLEPCDELIISDDSPELALSFEDSRIKYIQGPQQGAIKNFEFLLAQARGDILVLSDQDDVWLPGKLERTRELLCEDEPALLVHGAYLTDERLNKTGQMSARTGLVRNLFRNSYTGCCMAFTKQLLPYILPFPKNIPMHDQWIGLRAERYGSVTVLSEPLMLWRRHGAAQTISPSSFKQKITWRINMLCVLLRGGCR